MKSIPCISDDEQTIKGEIGQDRDPSVAATDIARLTSLQQGHRAFLRAIETGDYEQAKRELAEALFVDPHIRVWHFLCIVFALSEGNDVGKFVLVQFMNFWGRRDHRRVFLMMQLAFKNRFQTVETFLDKVKQDGITEYALSVWHEYPECFDDTATVFCEYADAIASNGPHFVALGDEVRQFARTVTEELKDIFPVVYKAHFHGQ